MSYATRESVEAVFGALSVAKWADLNNDRVEAHLAARIQTALTYANDFVDDVLRSGIYAVPVRTFGGSIPGVLVDCASKVAGYWLYTSRGTEDSDDESPVERLYKQAYGMLHEIRSGVLTLDAPRVHSQAPSIVPEIATSEEIIW